MKLNKIERLKTDLKPINYLQKLECIDFSNLQESDRFYLKNFGIYTQSQRADEFMLRIRVAGGRIGLGHLESIAALAEEFNAKLLITARAQIELQKLTPYTILDAYNRLESIGVTSWQTLTDNFRNIVTDVYDGVDSSLAIETYPLIIKMQQLFLKEPVFVGMAPRKFNTAIVGSRLISDSFFGNDCLFALARRDDEIGFNLYLGGKNNEVARDMDLFVTQEQVTELYKAVIDTYLQYGNRASRTKARLFYLLESFGLDRFRNVLQEQCSFNFKGSGKLLLQKVVSEDFKALKDGSFGYRFKSNFGEIDGESLQKIVAFAKEKSLEIRLGIDQNIYLIGLKEAKVPLSSLSENQNLLVCAGSRYCFFSLFDTKDQAAEINLEKINRYKIKIGYSGCLKGCGRHYFSDIGFVGIRTNLYGKLEFGVRLFLGGLYSSGESGARLIYWAVPLRALNSVLAVIIEEFELSGLSDFETFSKEVLAQFESEFLAFWFLAKLYTKKKYTLKEPEAFNNLLEGKSAIVSELKDGSNRLYESIKELEHRVYNKG